MLPFEFTVKGPPLSHQTRDRAKLRVWQERVRTAAAHRWGSQTPEEGNLRITVTYYHEGPANRIDNDNMLKPIQDALNGVVYVDDRQITDTSVRKTEIDGPVIARRAPLVLLQAYHEGEEFLHIVVVEAPDHSIPLR